MFPRILYRFVLFAGSLFLISGTCAAQHYVMRPVQAFVPMAEFGLKSLPEGLEGYCPVTLLREGRWAKGDLRLRAEFEGRTYFFAGKDYQSEFLDDPVRFAPVFSGKDVVQQAELGILADGFRRHGVFFRNRVFLFTSEEHLERFWSDPETYARPYMLAPRAPAASINVSETVRKYSSVELP